VCRGLTSDSAVANGGGRSSRAHDIMCFDHETLSAGEIGGRERNVQNFRCGLHHIDTYKVMI